MPIAPSIAIAKRLHLEETRNWMTIKIISTVEASASKISAGGSLESQRRRETESHLSFWHPLDVLCSWWYRVGVRASMTALHSMGDREAPKIQESAVGRGGRASVVVRVVEPVAGRVLSFPWCIVIVESAFANSWRRCSGHLVVLLFGVRWIRGSTLQERVKGRRRCLPPLSSMTRLLVLINHEIGVRSWSCCSSCHLCLHLSICWR
jgi:hypothetical protein